MKMIAKIKLYGVWGKGTDSGAWVRCANGRRIWYPSRAAAQSHVDEAGPDSGWEVRELETIEVEIETQSPS